MGKTKAIIGLVSLFIATGCGGNGSSGPGMPAGLAQKPNSQVGKQGSHGNTNSEVPHLEAWKKSLLKVCTTQALLDPNSSAVQTVLPSIDRELLLEQESPGFLRGPRGEFAVLGVPESPQSQEETQSTLPSGAVLTASRKGAVCKVSLGKEVLAEVTLIRKIPILAHFTQDKQDRLKSVQIAPAKLTEPSRAISQLPAPFFFDPVLQVLNPGTESIDFVAKSLGIQRNWSTNLFSLGSSSNLRASVLPIDSVNAAAMSPKHPHFLGLSDSIRPFFRTGSYDRSFAWIFELTRELYSSKDGNPFAWSFISKVNFNGSIPEGGVASLTSFQLAEPRQSEPKTALKCFIERLDTIFLIRPRSQREPFPNSFLEISEPCFALANDFSVSLIESPSAREKVFSLFDGFEPSETTGYRDWDRILLNLLILGLERNSDLQFMLPEVRERPILLKTIQDIAFFRKEIEKTPELKKYLPVWVTAAMEWALKGRKVESEIKSDLISILKRTGDLLEETSKRLILETGINPGSQAEAIQYALKISDRHIEPLIEAKLLASDLASGPLLSTRIASLYQKRPSFDEIEGWSESLRLLKPRLGRVESVQARALVKTALDETWKKETFERIDRVLSMLRWHPACRKEKEMETQAACIGLETLSRKPGKILSDAFEGRYPLLASQLDAELALVQSRSVSVAERVAQVFWSPLWGKCNARRFDTKRASLLQHLQNLNTGRTRADARTSADKKLDDLLSDCTP